MKYSDYTTERARILQAGKRNKEINSILGVRRKIRKQDARATREALERLKEQYLKQFDDH